MSVMCMINKMLRGEREREREQMPEEISKKANDFFVKHKTCKIISVTLLPNLILKRQCSVDFYEVMILG